VGLPGSGDSDSTISGKPTTVQPGRRLSIRSRRFHFLSESEESVAESAARGAPLDPELRRDFRAGETFPVGKVYCLQLYGGQAVERSLRLFMLDPDFCFFDDDIDGVGVVTNPDFQVSCPVGLGCPNPVDGAAVGDGEHPGGCACDGWYVTVGELPDFEENFLGDLFRLAGIDEDVPDDRVHAGGREGVQGGERGTIPRRHSAQESVRG